MTDYLLGIGGSSTMMIRDLGYSVEFWFQTGPDTWNNDQWWSYNANGGYVRQKFRLLRGGNWQYFGQVNVGTSQNVRFTIEASGLGWGTTNFDQFISRSTVPPPPTITQVTPTSTSAFHVVFVGNGDGGSTVDTWQIAYSVPNGPTSYVYSSGTSDIGGFNSGDLIYFWARGHNSEGWGNWSERAQGVTWTVPRAPSGPDLLSVTQTGLQAQYYFDENPNNPTTLERQLGYGTSSSAPTAWVSDPSGIFTLSALSPGGTYYIWGRSRNSVGWGPYSDPTQVALVAGARVLSGGQWKRAVPFVRVGGVWKVAEPWAKNQGLWKRTTN
jgi:hypothetical protein